MKFFNRFARTSCGNLHCPTCHSLEIGKLEEVSTYCYRYKCKKCGMTFRYDRSPTMGYTNPYGTFKRGLRDVEGIGRSVAKLKNT